jgi:hypothetical protein
VAGIQTDVLSISQKECKMWIEKKPENPKIRRSSIIRGSDFNCLSLCDDMQVKVGSVIFSKFDDLLVIDVLSVAGHHNASTAKNPHPGTGTLLLFLICREAFAQGAIKIALYPARNTEGFYRKFRFHGSSDEVITAAPVENIRQFVWSEGRILNPEWLKLFEAHLLSARRPARLEADTEIVLAVSKARVDKQWREV